MTTLHHLLISLLFYGLIFAGCYFFVIRKPALSGGSDGKLIIPLAGLGLAVLFCLQLVLAGLMPGHVQDTGLFRAWAAFAREHSVSEYYTTSLYVDYPPVYLYVLYGIGKLTGLFGIDTVSPLFLVFVRSVPILFDALTSLLVYRLAEAKLGQKKALCVALLCALNPMRIFTSSVWGQVDSVTTFFAAIMLLCLQNKKYIVSCILFALLFLTKPQMVMFAPLLGFVFFFDIVRQWHSRKNRNRLLWQAVCSLLAMVAVMMLVPLPATGGNYWLLLENYGKALGLYPYATLNAANLYGMLGHNWTQDSAKLLFFSYKTWGFVFIVLISSAVGFVSYFCHDRRKVLYMGVLTVLGIYMLGHGMHERYAYPALLLLLILYIESNEKKHLLFYGGFSLISFVVSGYVLELNLQNDFIYGNNLLFIGLSAFHVFLFILWVICAARELIEKERMGVQ